MDQRKGATTARTRIESAPGGSSVATHRKAERMRTYVYRPRAEARM